MAAKTPRKKSTGNKSDIKTTIIIIVLAVIALQVFLFFNKEKNIPKPRVATPTGDVVAPLKPPTKPYVAPPTVPVKRIAPLKKAVPGSAGKIAFILDDWGYSTRNCKYLQEIKAPIAVAILPNLKHTNDVVACAGAANKNIMLHLPLEPYQNKDKYPDNYLITTTMKPSLVVQILEDSLNKMPSVEGVNNHMGSKATEDAPLMKLIFKRLKKRNLFFVDSMTSPHHSVCGELASQAKLPFAARDVFLDNINTRPEIEKQIASLAQKARKKGYAIAIGHDRTLTLQVIQEQIPVLEAQGFTIVSIKDLLKNQ